MIKFRYPNNYIAITTYFSSKHTAIDIPYSVTCKGGKMNNVYCYAPCDMKIITNRWANDYGWFIEGQAIDERGTWIIGCGHFKSQSSLKVGANVKMADVVGLVGNTGTSGGPHVHYRLTLNGVRVNPLEYTYCYDDSQEVGIKEYSNILHYLPIKITPTVTRDTTKNQVEVAKIVRCRDIPSTSGNIIDEAQIGSIYNYYETRTADGYTWYRIADNQWLANNGTFLKVYVPIVEQPIVEPPAIEIPKVEEPVVEVPEVPVIDNPVTDVLEPHTDVIPEIPISTPVDTENSVDEPVDTKIYDNMNKNSIGTIIIQIIIKIIQFFISSLKK